MSIVCKVSRGVNQRFNSFFVISVYHPAFNIVTWTPFCLNVLGCLECLYYNDHQMRKRFLLQMVCGWINKHKHSISNVSFLCVISLNEFWKFLQAGNSAWDFFPGEALPYLTYTGIWGWTGYGFQIFDLVLSLKRYTISQLGVFLDWKPFKECEDLRWAVYICNTNNFFLNIYFHDFSVKSYLILYAKQISFACGSEMSKFCLKQGRGLKGLKVSAAHLFPNFDWVPTPPPPREFFRG